MRRTSLFLALLSASVVLAADSAAPLKDLSKRYPAYAWSGERIVRTDLNRDGKVDTVALGISDNKVALALFLSAKKLALTEIPIDASKQFGVCGGTQPTITVRAQSDAPLNAIGKLPEGYLGFAKCVEIVVSGGECDPLQFYWNTKSRKPAWWRA